MNPLRLGMGVIVCAALAVQCRQMTTGETVQRAPASPIQVEHSATPGPREAASPSAASSAAPSPAVTVADGKPEFRRLAHSDPLGFFKHCLNEYDRKIRDYHVTFTKQERLRGRMADEQVTEVRFRESPYSVDMVWTHNPSRASRVLYVEGARVDKHGRELAVVKPSGILGGIGIKVERDIHGPDAEVESRRSIDQFGFRKTLGLIILYCERALERGELSLRFAGEGTLDGRPTFIFERRLPYTGEDEPYPDRLLVVHIDQEWLLPTGCFSYADDAGRELLGKYLLTDASFNVGYSPADFDPARMNF